MNLKSIGRMKNLILTLSVVLWWCPSELNADRTNDKIYEPIPGAAPCFKQLNGTHEIGCSCNLSIP